MTSSADERTTRGEGAAAGGTGLFGRGLLYVVIWSLQIVSATFVSPVLAHLLGPSDFGRLSAAIALHQVLMVFAVFGLDQAVIVRAAEQGSAAAVRGLLAVATCLASAVTAVIIWAGPWWSPVLGFEGFSPLLVAAVLWTAPAASVQVMLAQLLSQDRLRAFSLVSVLAAVGGQVFGIALLLLHSRDAATYAWGGVISQCAAMAIALALTRPRPRGLVEWVPARRALVFGLPLMISGLAAFVLNASDRFVVQRLLGAEEVGRYQIAYTVGNVVVLLLTFTSQAWAPQITAVRDQRQRWALLTLSRDQLYRLLLPVTVGVTLAAPAVLRLVAPPSFRPETLLAVVFLVALSAFPVVAAGATGRALITVGRTRPTAVAAGVAAAGNVGLNLLLVPRLGIAGAALATVLSFAVQAAILRGALSPTPPWAPVPLPLVGAIVAVCSASAATLLLPQSPVWNAARFALALACLPWFAVRLRAARRSEIAGVPTDPPAEVATPDEVLGAPAGDDQGGGR